MEKELRTLLDTSCGVFTTQQAAATGIRRITLTRGVAEGWIERIGRGVYAAPDPLRRPDETYRLRVIGALRRRRPGDAASHHAALSLHGLPLHDVSFHRVDVDSHTQTHRRHGRLWVHPWTVGTRSVDIDGVAAVDVALACVQTAAESGFSAGVVAMDAALHERRVSRRQLLGAARACTDHVGVNTARAAIRFSDGRTESPGESLTRIILAHNDFAFTPQFVVRRGRRFVARVDFLVEGRLVVEFDGEIKYQGDDAEEVRAAQELREIRLRRCGYAVLRLKWAGLADPGGVVRRIREELATLAA